MKGLSLSGRKRLSRVLAVLLAFAMMMTSTGISYASEITGDAVAEATSSNAEKKTEEPTPDGGKNESEAGSGDTMNEPVATGSNSAPEREQSAAGSGAADDDGSQSEDVNIPEATLSDATKVTVTFEIVPGREVEGDGWTIEKEFPDGAKLTEEDFPTAEDIEDFPENLLLGGWYLDEEQMGDVVFLDCDAYAEEGAVFYATAIDPEVEYGTALMANWQSTNDSVQVSSKNGMRSYRIFGLMYPGVDAMYSEWGGYAKGRIELYDESGTQLATANVIRVAVEVEFSFTSDEYWFELYSYNCTPPGFKYETGWTHFQWGTPLVITNSNYARLKLHPRMTYSQSGVCGVKQITMVSNSKDGDKNVTRKVFVYVEDEHGKKNEAAGSGASYTFPGRVGCNVDYIDVVNYDTAKYEAVKSRADNNGNVNNSGENYRVDLVRKKYNVTYSVSGTAPEGWTKPTDTSVRWGDSYTVAAAPNTVYKKEGGNNVTYTFDGWKIGSEVVSGKTREMPVANVTITGKWTKTSTPIIHTVEYRSSGNKPSTYNDPASAQVAVGINYTPEAVDVVGYTEKGTNGNILKQYTFDGWKKDGVKVTGSFAMPDNDVTLTGEWKLITDRTEESYKHNVTYEYASDSVITSERAQLPAGGIYTAGDNVPIAAAPAPVELLTTEKDTWGNSLKEYTFDGWFYEGRKISNLTMPDNDVTLTGKWTAKDITPAKHKVTYEIVGEAYGVSVPSQETVTHNQQYTVKPGLAKADDKDTYGNVLKTYTFDGWYQNENCTGDKVNSIKITGDVTLYGKWSVDETESDTYNRTVTYEITGEVRPEKEYTVPDPDTVTLNQTNYKVQDMPDAREYTERDEYNNLLKEYSFDGWKLNGKKVTSIAKIEGNYTLTGSWTVTESYEQSEYEHTVSYAKGENAPASYEAPEGKTYIQGQSYNVADAPDNTAQYTEYFEGSSNIKAEYEFLEWTDDEGNSIEPDSPQIMGDDDVIYTAVWEKTEHTEDEYTHTVIVEYKEKETEKEIKTADRTTTVVKGESYNVGTKLLSALDSTDGHHYVLVNKDDLTNAAGTMGNSDITVTALYMLDDLGGPGPVPDDYPDEYEGIILFTADSNGSVSTAVNPIVEKFYELNGTPLVDSQKTVDINATAVPHDGYALEMWTLGGAQMSIEAELTGSKELKAGDNFVYNAVFASAAYPPIPDKYLVTVKFEAENGTVKDDAVIYEDARKLLGNKLEVSLGGKTEAAPGNAFLQWKNEKNEVMEGVAESGTYTIEGIPANRPSSYTLTAFYSADEFGEKGPNTANGIADAYEALVVYSADAHGKVTTEAKTYWKFDELNGSDFYTATAKAEPTEDEFAFDYWTASGSATLAVGKKNTNPLAESITVQAGNIYTYTAHFDTDQKGPDGPDGIPDKYEIVVTYKAQNGTFEGGAAEETKTLVKVDENGDWDENGSAMLGDTIPTVGANPDLGYKAGRWQNDQTPAADTKIKVNTIYTYEYLKNSFKVTVKYVSDDETALGQDEYTHVYVFEENYDVSSDEIILPSITADGVTYTKDSVNGTVKDTMPAHDVTITVTYSRDMVGSDDGPDGIPDKYQYTVEYRSEDAAKGRVEADGAKVYTLGDAASGYLKEGTHAVRSAATGTGTYTFDYWSGPEDVKYPVGEQLNIPDFAVKGGETYTFTAHFDTDVIGTRPESPEVPGDGIPDKYQAEVIYESGENGSVQPAGSIVTTFPGFAEKGDVEVEAAATENEGFAFDCWTENGDKLEDQGAALQMTLTDVVGGSKITYKANFDKDGNGDKIPDKYQAIIRFVSAGNGTVEPEILVSGKADEGEKVSVSPSAVASASKGYAFDYWAASEGAVLTESKKNEAALSETFEAEAGKTYTYTAHFDKDEIGGDDEDGDGKPDGDGIPDKYQYTVTYTAGANGSISNKDAGVYIETIGESGNYGTEESYIAQSTATAAKGYAFDRWRKDGESVGSDAALEYTFTAQGGEAYEFEAGFGTDKIGGGDEDGDGEPDGDGIPDKYQYTVTYTAGANGSISDKDAGVYVETIGENGSYGTEETYTAQSTAAAAEGYAFDLWMKDGEPVGSDAALEYTFTAQGGEAYEFEASFGTDKIGGGDEDGDGEPDGDGIPDRYQTEIVYVAGENGTVAPERQIITFDENTVSRIALIRSPFVGRATSGSVTARALATAAAGYAFDRWTRDGEPIESGAALEQTFAAEGGTTYTFEASFGEDRIGGGDENGDGEPDGDGIPDKYQVSVTYQVSHGTWADGTRDSITEVVTLRDADGNISAEGSARLEKVPGVPGTADSGYSDGGWDTIPENVTKADDNKTYSYSYSETASQPSGGSAGGSSDDSSGNGSATTEIPDNEVPLAEIPDNPVPLAAEPLEMIAIEDEDVPLAFLAPMTGDNRPVGAAALFGLLALGMMGAFGILGFKKKDEEEA